MAVKYEITGEDDDGTDVGGGIRVEAVPMMKAREFPLGFDFPAGVAPAITESVVSAPQILFRIERLVIPSDIGGSFIVEEIVVGKNPQFAATRVGVPARGFDERAVGVSLMGDTATVNQDVILKVENIAAAPIRFQAMIIGTAIES